MIPKMKNVDCVDLNALWTQAKADGKVTESEVQKILQVAAPDMVKNAQIVKQAADFIGQAARKATTDTRSALERGLAQPRTEQNQKYLTATESVYLQARRNAYLAQQLSNVVNRFAKEGTARVEADYAQVVSLTRRMPVVPSKLSEDVMTLLSNVPGHMRPALATKLRANREAVSDLMNKTAFNPRLQAFLFEYFKTYAPQ